MKRPEKDGIHLIKPVPFCQSLGSVVAIYNTPRSWGIIIAYCLIFHRHYMLLQRFRNHAESGRKPFHRINIYDCIICQHLQTLTQTAAMASGWRELGGPADNVWYLRTASFKTRCKLSVGVFPFVTRAVGWTVWNGERKAWHFLLLWIYCNCSFWAESATYELHFDFTDSSRFKDFFVLSDKSGNRS